MNALVEQSKQDRGVTIHRKDPPHNTLGLASVVEAQQRTIRRLALRVHQQDEQIRILKALAGLDD
jgi:hypothetical protein